MNGEKIERRRDFPLCLVELGDETHEEVSWTGKPKQQNKI